MTLTFTSEELRRIEKFLRVYGSKIESHGLLEGATDFLQHTYQFEQVNRPNA